MCIQSRPEDFPFCFLFPTIATAQIDHDPAPATVLFFVPRLPRFRIVFTGVSLFAATSRESRRRFQLGISLASQRIFVPLGFVVTGDRSGPVMVIVLTTVGKVKLGIAGQREPANIVTGARVPDLIRRSRGRVVVGSVF